MTNISFYRFKNVLKFVSIQTTVLPYNTLYYHVLDSTNYTSEPELGSRGTVVAIF